MLGLFLVLAAGAATTTIPTTDDPDRPQIRVPYRDLNLNSVEGTKRLEMRVRQAVAELCGNSGGGAISRQPEKSVGAEPLRWPVRIMRPNSP